MYIVIKGFTDLQDDNHSYDLGRIYPYEKKDVSSERVEELISNKNKLKEPLIKEVTLEEMNDDQLIEYAKIEGLDLKKIILDKFQNTTDSEEFEKLIKVAKRKKLEVPEDITLEELRELISGNK